MTNNDWDSYFIEGTNVLKNKLGITDYDELEKAEKIITADKLRYLIENPIENPTYDKRHLKTIHQYLFEDIYDFAGKYRTVNMAIGRNDVVGPISKGSYSINSFVLAPMIDYELDKAFDRVNNEIDYSRNINEYSEALARFYATLIHIHPFREGNGRTSREFIREYSNFKRKEKDFEIGEFKWTKIDREVLHEGIDVAMIHPGNISLEFMKTLKSGTPAPEFTLPDKDGKEVSLSDFRGQKVVLYFYSKDNTSGCTRQANAFAALYDEFKEVGAQVIGISKDSSASHFRFAEKHSLPFVLLSDPERKAIEPYGVWQEKKLYGKVSMGVVRTTFIIDENGVIEKIMSKVKPDANAADALEFLKTL